MANEIDLDPQETHEWVESLESVLEREGPARAHFLLEEIDRQGEALRRVFTLYREYRVCKYDSALDATPIPGDQAIEHTIRSVIRWNAAAMVVHANRKSSELGGHIASFASAATLYDVGFSHFFRAPGDENKGDLVFFQGHSAPGIYARAFLEGRLSEEQLNLFRQEALNENGLSSYPHPWLMPDFWQFPTVSMGLGPLMAIYQARFMKYLENREIQPQGDRKVWAFMGDGEMDEPESLGVISLATRENLDNLILWLIVICNDSTVRCGVTAK